MRRSCSRGDRLVHLGSPHPTGNTLGDHWHRIKKAGVHPGGLPFLFATFVAHLDEARQITRLAAQDALDVLADMRANSAWQQSGRIVGRPVLRFPLHDAQCEPEWVLADTIG